MPLAFERVTYRYDDALPPALDEVTLDVADGEFVCIVGRTGSGKSTLAEHAVAIKTPAAGRVLVDGLDTADRRSRREVRRRAGYVMQYPEYQLFAETVAEDVAFGPRNLGFSPSEVDAAVREAIERVGLAYDEVADASPFDLSGGQKRRVALAGVLAMGPRVLVVDEPMAGLDPQGRLDVMGIVRDLHADGATVLMVTHSMDDVAEHAQHVVVLDRGRVVDEGSPAEVFSHADVLAGAGLDLPQAARVARDLQARGFAFPGGLPLTVDGLARAVANQLPDLRASGQSTRVGPLSADDAVAPGLSSEGGGSR